MKAFAYLVFPNSVISIIPEGPSHLESETMEHGIITSVTHGVMSGSFHTHPYSPVVYLHIKPHFIILYNYQCLENQTGLACLTFSQQLFWLGCTVSGQ